MTLLAGGHIRLDVVGLPAPQGSKTQVGKIMIEGKSKVQRANLEAWREAVRNEARDHLGEHPANPLDEPIELEATFRFPPVASDPHRYFHATEPDLDKIIRSTQDALTQSGIIRDDARVCALKIHKRYAQPGESIGVTLIIRPQGAAEANARAFNKEQAKQRKAAASA
jgi:Holliday junction resolvase RusA-like endonuclease